MHRRIAFDIEQLRHLDRCRLGNARQIVAQKIDNHQIFCTLFGIGAQFIGQARIDGCVSISQRSSLHRLCCHTARAQSEE